MDMGFIGGVNSIYALIGLGLMLFFQMWLKSKEDKKYRDERILAEEKYRKEKQELEQSKIENAKKMHAEEMEQTKKSIDLQQEQTKAIIESLNRNNEITDLHTENIIDIAEVIDKKHKTKKAPLYREKYSKAEGKHKKKL